MACSCCRRFVNKYQWKINVVHCDRCKNITNETNSMMLLMLLLLMLSHWCQNIGDRTNWTMILMLLILKLSRSKRFGGKWSHPANCARFPEAVLRNRFHPPALSDFPQIPASGPAFRSRLWFSKRFRLTVLMLSEDDRIWLWFPSDPVWILNPRCDHFRVVPGVGTDKRILENLAQVAQYRAN